MLIVLIFKMYLVLRVVDIAETEHRRVNNLPEKRMITDEIHKAVIPEETQEEKIKRLELELEQLKQEQPK